jgi:hypothetical protein
VTLVVRHDNETPESDVESLAPIVLEMHSLGIRLDVYSVRLPLGFRPENFEDLMFVLVMFCVFRLPLPGSSAQDRRLRHLARATHLAWLELMRRFNPIPYNRISFLYSYALVS